MEDHRSARWKSDNNFAAIFAINSWEASFGSLRLSSTIHCVSLEDFYFSR